MRRRGYRGVGGIERIDVGLAGVEVFGVGDAGGLRHVVVGLGPGVVGQEREAVAHRLVEGGLEGVVVGVADHAGDDHLGVACRRSRWRLAQGPTDGRGVVDAALVGAKPEPVLTAGLISRLTN